MNRLRIGNLPLRRRTLATLLAPLALAGGMRNVAGQDVSVATPGTTATATSAAAASACGCLYSVINLDPEGGAFPLLNQRGQAAVGSFLFGTNRFFDGDRLYDIGSLGGGYTLVRALNNLGVVVGASLDDSEPFGQFYAFKWTLARGMRALPDSAGGSAYDINDRNQVAGLVPAPGVSQRAVRWDPNGTRLVLGTQPLSGAEAWAINNQALAGGFFDAPGAGDIHAAVWDAAGHQIDLGSLGTHIAFTQFVNERNEAAGYAEPGTNETEFGFYWNARDGVIPTGAVGAGRLLVALNDRGEIAGDTNIPGGRGAYLWSRREGLRLLPRGPGVETDAFALNNKTQLVGRLRLASGGERAVRWNGLGNPVDLNTLLYRPPAGLVLQAGTAVNDAGDILAYSNAGLVLLRPGIRGTDAPVLGPVSGLPASVGVGQDVRLTLGFVDNSPTQTHKVSVEWTDNCVSPHPLVRESGGVGEASFQHRFCTPGYYFLTVRVTDSGGRTTEMRRDVVVNAPGLAAISGQGTLAHAVDDARDKGRALRFALWAPAGNAAGGAPYFGLSGPFHFRSERIGTPAIGARQGRVEGTGRFNGRPGYRFLADALDGSHLHVRILHTDANGKDVVDFDNASPGDGAAAAKAAAASSTAADRTLVSEGGLTLGG